MLKCPLDSVVISVRQLLIDTVPLLSRGVRKRVQSALVPGFYAVCLNGAAGATRAPSGGARLHDQTGHRTHRDPKGRGETLNMGG